MNRLSPSPVELRHAVLLLDALLLPARRSAPAIHALATQLLRFQLVSLALGPTTRAAQDAHEAIRRLEVEIEEQHVRTPVAGISRIGETLTTLRRFIDVAVARNPALSRHAVDHAVEDNGEPLARIWSRLMASAQPQEAEHGTSASACASSSLPPSAGGATRRGHKAAQRAWSSRIEPSFEPRAA